MADTQTTGGQQARFESALRDGEKALARADPMMRRLIRAHGPCGLAPRWRRSPYESLVRAVVYQQLNGKAAATILARFMALFPGERFPPPAAVLARDEAALKSAGLSRQKLGYIRDVALKAVEGSIPTHRRGLHAYDDDTLIEQFTQARGVGRWTVEMMLIFSMGRLDVLPVDDYGVRAGYSRVAGLPDMVGARQLADIGARWAPWRSVAAWYFWRAADDKTETA